MNKIWTFVKASIGRPYRPNKFAVLGATCKPSPAQPTPLIRVRANLRFAKRSCARGSRGLQNLGFCTHSIFLPCKRRFAHVVRLPFAWSNEGYCTASLANRGCTASLTKATLLCSELRSDCLQTPCLLTKAKLLLASPHCPYETQPGGCTALTQRSCVSGFVRGFVRKS